MESGDYQDGYRAALNDFEQSLEEAIALCEDVLEEGEIRYWIEALRRKIDDKA